MGRSSVRPRDNSARLSNSAFPTLENLSFVSLPSTSGLCLQPWPELFAHFRLHTRYCKSLAEGKLPNPAPKQTQLPAPSPDPFCLLSDLFTCRTNPKATHRSGRTSCPTALSCAFPAVRRWVPAG